MIPQPVVDIAEICALKGIRHAVLSPGSRNAPLLLAFARHPKIETHVIPDERSAGFIALGIAQKLKRPVVLVCTSGSAVYNYAPAVAEAFYSTIPLVVISADRPPEWIDQRDGQTIRQSGIFGNHVKRSFDFPDQYSNQDVKWHCHRIVNDAINIANCGSPGPVNINVPLREPFYPEKSENIHYSKDIKIINEPLSKSKLHVDDFDHFEKSVSGYNKVLFVVGQTPSNSQLRNTLGDVAKSVPVLCDIISNAQSVEGVITNQDLILANYPDNDLSPDLLVTIGQSVISKNLKGYLRKHRPTAHWHIQPSGDVADTFQSLTEIIRSDEIDFLNSISSEFDSKPDYLQKWHQLENKVEAQISSISGWWELPITKSILEQCPNECQLHLGNSMPIRWANYVGCKKEQIEVFSNRGTSGIDGCMSTAVGCAMACDETVLVILGDLSFFYDRNALWHNELPPNLRIVVLNNHGGGIFRLINGPSDLAELGEYFETDQKLNTSNTIKDFEIEYLSATSETNLAKALETFFLIDGKAKLLEIFTDSSINKVEFEKVRAGLKKL
ncbi:MAG: 2-succinyl-5-enolpyruvyl-6-hydroxy-3-cyclohexene-1-carboxylic-acid synthase [Cyclobacteriaceae bacterium]